MNNYQIEKKVKGGKIEVRILLDGVEIGKRTSARLYRFALLTKGNQAHALACAKENLAYQIKEAAKYRAVANDEPGAREKFIRFDRNGRVENAQTQQWNRDYIANGEVLKWADNADQQIKSLEARIEKLSSGPQPEYDVVCVASWHQTRKNVPSCKDYQIFVDVVEIPE